MIKPINQTLLTPRVKELPKSLIYKVPTIGCYRMFETKTGNYLGEMRAFTEKNIRKIYDMDEDSQIYRVYSLKIKSSERHKGWGTCFMNFAKRQSYRTGCEGRMFLIAYNPLRAPQIFYKKLGFAAVDKSVDKVLDNCIKTNVQPLSHPACMMYMPLEKVQEEQKEQKEVNKTNFWGRVKRFLGIKKINW